jgi:membrane protein required for colicin V production
MGFLQAINGFDLLALAIVLFFVLGSLWRGAMVEFFWLIGWVAAFLLARLYADAIGRQFFSELEPAFLRAAVAWVSIFIVVLLAAHLLGAVFKQALHKTGLSTADRLLGALFGFAKACVLLLTLVWVAGYTPLATSQLFAQSATAKIAQSVIALVRQSHGWAAQGGAAKALERTI